MIGSATERPLGFMLALGFLGGAALITIEWATTRGPLVLFGYAAIILAAGFYLRLELVQDWRSRFLVTLGSFMLATLTVYLFIGVVLTRQVSEISAWGHAWRLGLMLVIGSALSAAVAQLAASKVAK